MNKRKFVIGIGSQRAGSTLLHRILNDCTNIFMHPVKELHYFDTLYKIRNQDVLTKYSKIQLDREFARLISSKDHSYINNNKYKCFFRTNKILFDHKIENIDYIDLFRPCLMNNEYLGEITPEYMILPEKGVEHMSKTLGNETPIILLTRNPVDRFISAFKLLKFYGNENVDMDNFEEEILEVFETMPGWIEQQKQLNDYNLAFEKYSKYFNNVLILSYDDLIHDVEKTHLKLETLLNTSVDIVNYKRILGNKINSIVELDSLKESTILKLTKLL